MTALRYALLSDGSSDRALLPLLTWLLQQYVGNLAVEATWADLRGVISTARTLTDRVVTAIDRYPCDLLLVHRDAERQPASSRVGEIRRACDRATKSTRLPPIIPVVPVRMHEAWLLFDEAALRNAAENPNGRARLQLPARADLERLPDPKSVLYDLLRDASGLTGRRRRQFDARDRARRVPEFIDDFSPLRALPAFRAVEADVAALVPSLRMQDVL